MALHRMGLGAEFSLNVNPAVKSANSARASIGKLKRGVTQLGLAATPVAIAFGAGVAAAAKFEQQMSAVQSVSGATSAEIQGLAKEAKQLALDTKFSHIEAAEGMEVMTRAGFDQIEMMEALRPVMDAAAADNIALATSADIVASAVRGMGLDADQAGRVADVLAAASANSNTNITLLGESTRYAAAQAKTAGIDYETMIASLGVLGDAGLKGSIAGTSFANMLVKMAKPTAKGTKLMEKYGVSVLSLKDGTVDIIGTMQKFGPAIDSIPKSIDKAAFVAEVFGIRGQKAVNAIVTSIKKGRFEQLHEKLLQAKGTAKKMAELRLNNAAGQWTKLKKSIGVLSTEVFGPMLKEVAGLFRIMHGGISKVLKAGIEWQAAIDDFDREDVRKKYGVYLEIALGIQDAAKTLSNAMKSVRNAIKKVAEAFGAKFGEDGARQITKYVIVFSAMLAVMVPLAIAVTGLGMAFSGLATIFGSLGISALIAKLTGLTAATTAAKAAASGGAGAVASTAGGAVQGLMTGSTMAQVTPGIVAPTVAKTGLMAGLAAKGKSVGTMFAGIGAKIGAGLLPVLKILAPLLLAIMLIFGVLGEKGDSIGQTFTKIGQVFKDLWNNAIKPFWEGLKTGFLATVQQLGSAFMESISNIQTVLQPLKDQFGELFMAISEWLDGSSVDWKMVGTVIMGIISAVLETVVTLIGWIATAIALLLTGFGQLGEFIGEFIGMVVNNIIKLKNWILKAFEGGFINGIKKVFNGLLKIMLTPFQLLVRGVIKAVDALGGASFVPDVARNWANSDTIFSDIDTSGFGGNKEARDMHKKQKEKRDQEKKDADELLAIRKKNARRSHEQNKVDQSDQTAMVGLLNEIQQNTKKTSEKDPSFKLGDKDIAKSNGKAKQIDHERGGGGHQSWTRRRSYEQGN